LERVYKFLFENKSVVCHLVYIRARVK